MRTLGLMCLVAVVSLATVCTDLFRDVDGSAALDPVLIVSLGAALWGGPALGLWCGLAGGLGQASATTALVYGTAAVLVGSWERGWLPLVAGAVALLATVLLAGLHGFGLNLGLASMASALPGALHNGVVVALLPLARRVCVPAWTPR